MKLSANWDPATKENARKFIVETHENGVPAAMEKVFGLTDPVEQLEKAREIQGNCALPTAASVVF